MLRVNTIWLGVDNLIRSLIGFCISLYLARHLGPADFGIYALMVTLFLMFNGISSFGINDIFIKNFVTVSDRGLILGSTVFIFMISGIISFLIFLVVMHTIYEEQNFVHFTYIIGIILIFKPFDVIKLYNEALIISKYTVFSQLTANSIFAVLKVIAIIKNADLKFFFYLYALEIILTLSILAGLFFLKSNYKKLQLKIDTSQVLKLLRQATPLFFASFAVILNMRIDQLMLGKMVNSEAVGIYNIAVKVSDIPIIGITILISTMFPVISKAHLENKQRFHMLLSRMYGGLFWLSLLASILVIIIGELTITLVMGDEYASVATILKFYIMSSVSIAIGSVWTKWLILENKSKICVAAQYLAVIINIILNLLMIPRFGIEGAALATLISYSLSLMISLFMYKPRLTLYLISQGIIFRRSTDV
jgi:O-antigen/teichoic acid export membrane protein